jgi:hypothetical protein
MLFDVSEISNYLQFRSAIGSPTIRIDRMTVTGE